MRARDIIAFLLLLAIAFSSYFGRDAEPPAPPSSPPPQEDQRRPPPQKYSGVPWDAETRDWLTERPAAQNPVVAENFRLPSTNEVQIDDKRRSSAGTAFSVGDGVWLTARHVVDGCDDVGLQTAPKRGVRASDVVMHPNADVALIRTKNSRAGFPVAAPGSKTDTAYMVGFPASKPGAVSATLIGPSTLRERGRYKTFEPVMVWSERDRVPDRFGSLAGLSGGPVFSADGSAIGVVLAENTRRGRIITAVPETMRGLIGKAGATLSAAPVRSSFSNEGYPVTARELITSLRVSRVLCQVGS